MNTQYHHRMGQALGLARPGGRPRHGYWTQKKPGLAARHEKSRESQHSRRTEEFEGADRRLFEFRHTGNMVEPRLGVVASLKVVDRSKQSGSLPAGEKQLPFKAGGEFQTAGEFRCHVVLQSSREPARSVVPRWPALTGPWVPCDTASQGGACGSSRNDIPGRFMNRLCLGALSRFLNRPGGCGTRYADGTTFTAVAELGTLSSSAAETSSGASIVRSAVRKLRECVRNVLSAARKKNRKMIRSVENGALVTSASAPGAEAKRGEMRRSNRLAPFLMQSIFFLAAVSCCQAQDILLMGHAAGGSVYKINNLDTWDPSDALGRFLILYGPSIEYTSSDQNWAYPGIGAGNFVAGGQYIIVPPGESWTIRQQYWAWTSPSTNTGWTVHLNEVKGGTAGSYTGPGSGYVGPEKDVNLTIPGNTSDFSVTYRLIEAGSGDTLGEWTMAPGTPASNVSVTGLPNDSVPADFELVYKVNGYTLEGESWKPVPLGTETFMTVTPQVGEDNLVDAGTIPSITNRVTVIQPVKIPVVGDPGTGAAGTVWNTSGTGTAPTDALTNTVFREGVDKIVKQQQVQIDAEKEKKEALDADKEAFDEAISTGGRAAAESKVNSEYEAAKTAIASNIDGGGVVQSSLPSGSSIWAFNVAGVDVNIFPAGNLLIGANIIKLLLQAIMIYGWIVFMQLECRDILKAAGLAPQARGNTLGGSGGQVTAAFAASLLTIVVLAVPVAMAALSDNGIGWRTTVNFIESFTGGGSVGNGAVEWLSEYFPILTFLAIMNNVVLFKIAGTAIMGAAMVAAKWVIFVVVLGCALNLGSSRAQADITWRNSSSVDVLINGAVTVTANSTLDVAPVGGSMYLVEGAFGERSVEALDLALVCVTEENITVAHPSSAWWVYVLRGFVMGCLANIGGMVIRLFSRVGGGVETP